ncbi:MAG TPA: MlaD family protein [Myxococcota bacterium]|nr:MlaD family protein [Myxococcota bacterium]
MDGNRRISIIVGAFVIAGLAALALTILSLSSQQGVFRDRYRLVAYFENVQGLLANAPVWLAGRQVGRVESVGFSPEGTGRPALRVILHIDVDVQDRIRADSVASIGTIGLLGDRYVEVSIGSPTAPPIADGGELATVTPTNINLVIDRGAQALENVAKLTSNLNSVVEEFGQATGGRRLAESVGALSEVVEQIQQGKGLLHSVIYDQYEGGGVESIERSLVTFEGILDQIAHGDGVLHTLIYDAPSEQDIVLEAIEAGSRLNSILAKVDRGEGTMGLLLNDPTLYEDLKRLIGGAERSRAVRTLIKLSGAGDGKDQ